MARKQLQHLELRGAPLLQILKWIADAADAGRHLVPTIMTDALSLVEQVGACVDLKASCEALILSDEDGSCGYDIGFVAAKVGCDSSDREGCADAAGVISFGLSKADASGDSAWQTLESTGLQANEIGVLDKYSSGAVGTNEVGVYIWLALVHPTMNQAWVDFGIEDEANISGVIEGTFAEDVEGSICAEAEDGDRFWNQRAYSFRLYWWRSLL
jgi:hypothetical protein